MDSGAHCCFGMCFMLNALPNTTFLFFLAWEKHYNLLVCALLGCPNQRVQTPSAGLQS